MASTRKCLELVLSGRSDQNVRFTSLQGMLRALGFAERVKGGHFIYTRPDVVEIINIQLGLNGKAKPYQVKQVRGIITAYGLGLL